MILKNKNGGVIKLQHAGIMPSVSLQQIVDAANSGDVEKAELLKKQFQLEQAKRIYADNNGEEIKTTTNVPYTGVITQGRDKLYNNAYDRWTANTAKGQEFKRFVEGPLKFAVENGLLLTTGLGTATRLAEAGKLAKGLSTASKVAPLWQDLAYTAGTSYFATQGLNGLKQDIWGKRQFNPLVTTMDALMTLPAVAAIKPTVRGIEQMYNSGNMWARALRGEPASVRRVKRFFSNSTANNDFTNSLGRMEQEVSRAISAGEDALADRKTLQNFISNRSDPNAFSDAPLSDVSFSYEPVGRIPQYEYSPTSQTVTFTNPITGETTTDVMQGVTKRPDWEVSVPIPYRGSRLMDGYWTFGRRRATNPINVVEKGNSRTISENSQTLIDAIAKYRDMVNAKLKGKAIVGGSTHSIAEGLHSGVPNDLELYTSDKYLDDVIREFKITVTDKSPRRIKGTSPYAINGQVDLHTLDPNGPDVEELGALLSPEEHAAKRYDDLFKSFRGLFRRKPKTASKKEIENYFETLKSDPSVLTDLMRKNNLQGIGGTDAAQEKFTRRQIEMGLKLPLEDLDRTFDQIEAQIPGFVTFGEAYPNFDYTNIEGNKAFLRYFGLPESYATDFERMKRLYRQQHIQFTPGIREFEGAKSMSQAQRMGRKNAQYSNGSASGGGGNMLISTSAGGFGGTSPQNTAAQYLPTHHPEKITTGAEYVDSIEKTKLFERKIIPEEDAALTQLLGPDYLKDKRNLSDVLEAIADKDLYNPKPNKTIQAISKIIDVPRMTGVRYGGTNSIYVGNLSGEPISETFTLGKPFEFGRSFNESLAPSRDGAIYGASHSVPTVDDLPLEGIPKSEVDNLRKRVQEWRDLLSNPKASTQQRGMRYIDTIEDAQAEMDRLEKIPIQKIDLYDVGKRYHDAIGNKLYKTSDRLYNLRERLLVPTFLVGVSSAIGGLTYKTFKDDKKAQMMYGRNDDYFKNAYEQSPEYFPYEFKRTGKDWTKADVKYLDNFYDNQDAAWKDWYNKNKTAIERDWKERRPIRKEARRIEKAQESEKRAETKAKIKAEREAKKKAKKK